MTAMGLEPSQMSRPNDVRRKGFVEAQGGGTFLLTRGDIALRMGLPVYAVIGYAASHADGIHRSIPAPGQGVLAVAMGGRDSPLGRALADHGLTADDIAVVSKHDTSTGANDPNESRLHDRIQTALGRSEGNPLFVVSQKSLTGHAKGGAAAWQLGGLCQMLATGTVAGNRNLESVDPALRPHRHLCWGDDVLQAGPAVPLRAGLLTSLGFGHVGALVLAIHPDSFTAALTPEQLAHWQAAAAARQARGRQKLARAMMGQVPLYERRTHRRFDQQDGSEAQQDEEAMLLTDPAARLGQDGRYGGRR
jgi:fatty acid synthase